MLRPSHDFKNLKLSARDGDIGKAKDFLFDDEQWLIRYLVADTGGWLNGRRVLLSPHALKPVNDANQVIPVDLTKKQIENSPVSDSDKPVSRQFEVEYYGYYGWPGYWSGSAAMGINPYFGVSAPHPIRTEDRSVPLQHKEWDLHLRSTHEVCGYHIHAMDDTIGHVDDVLIDDEAWTINYLIVDTQNWWPGKHVAVSPKWIERVSSTDSEVFVNLTRSVIKGAPEFPADGRVTREYEAALHQYYDKHIH